MSFPLELVTGRTRHSQVLRPSVPDDAPRLVTMFERCSPASRYARFLAPLRYFPAVAPHRRGALVADPPLVGGRRPRHR